MQGGFGISEHAMNHNHQPHGGNMMGTPSSSSNMNTSGMGMGGGSSNSNSGGGGGFGNAFGSGFGGQAAQNMLLDIGKQNLEQYMKVGEQSFLSNYLPFVRDLRQYFRVDHQYVLRKAGLLFAPYLQSRIARGSSLSDHAFTGGASVNSSISRPSTIRSASAIVGGVNTQYNFGDDGGYNSNNGAAAPGGSPTPQVVGTMQSPTTAMSPNGQQQLSSSNNFKMPTPTDDILAPDLYIPSMALLTYVALCGFIRGLSDNSLAPEFLAAMLWSLILWELFEVACVMIASYALMTPMVTLDALALSGYKHVGICVLLLLRELLGMQDSYIYLVPVAYVAGCAVLFAYNMIKMFIARRGDGTVHVRSMPLLYGWAGVQALFVFWFAMKPF